MVIGVPKEIKTNENRVGVVPAGVEAFVRAGHEVVVETGAGHGSGFADEAYETAGARIMQGYLEGSNVDPLTEMASMISVQRAYELGQSFMDREDERARTVIQTLGR